MQRFIFFILFFIFIFHCSYVCSSGVCKSDSCRFIKGGDKTIKQKRWLSFKRIESGHLINQNDDLCQILSQPNCRFIVRSDFDLKGLTIHVGNNSVLVFNGGSLNNGYLIFDNNLLENPSDNCINNCKCKGLLQNDYLKPEWFGAKGDGIHDDYYALKATFTLTNRAVLGIKKHYQINTIPEEHKRESSVYTFFEIEKNLVVEGNHSTIEVRRSSLSNIKHRPYINRIIFLPLADYFTISDLNVVINRDISDIYSRENNIYDGGINYIYAMCPHLSVSNSTLINNGEYNNVTFCFAQTALKHVIDHCVFFDNSLSYAGGFYWLMERINPGKEKRLVEIRNCDVKLETRDEWISVCKNNFDYPIDFEVLLENNSFERNCLVNSSFCMTFWGDSNYHDTINVHVNNSVFRINNKNSSLPEIKSILLYSDFYKEGNIKIKFVNCEIFDSSNRGNLTATKALFSATNANISFRDCNINTKWAILLRAKCVDFTNCVINAFLDVPRGLYVTQNYHNCKVNCNSYFNNGDGGIGFVENTTWSYATSHFDAATSTVRPNLKNKVQNSNVPLAMYTMPSSHCFLLYHLTEKRSYIRTIVSLDEIRQTNIIVNSFKNDSNYKQSFYLNGKLQKTTRVSCEKLAVIYGVSINIGDLFEMIVRDHDDRIVHVEFLYITGEEDKIELIKNYTAIGSELTNRYWKKKGFNTIVKKYIKNKWK